MSAALQAAKAEVLRLERERAAIESEMGSLAPQLGAAGMDQPLVDGECATRGYLPQAELPAGVTMA
jgi:hypothetical protein